MVSVRNSTLPAGSSTRTALGRRISTVRLSGWFSAANPTARCSGSWALISIWMVFQSHGEERASRRKCPINSLLGAWSGSGNIAAPLSWSM